ncbi:thioredoxin [bacterium]|jgi:thioredoxin 1|nr:thioredoxin [bacterium]
MGTSPVTDQSFQEDVVNYSEKLVLVDFWAEWCGPCRALGPVIESISVKLEDKVKVLKLDTDQNPETAQNFEITGIPCCILFKDGKEVKRITGFKPAAAFESEIEAFL